jgi:hypothetical protein
VQLILEDTWNKFCTYFSSSQHINTGLHSLQQLIITTVIVEDDWNVGGQNYQQWSLAGMIPPALRGVTSFLGNLT